jgi:hypothetical protein
MQRATKKANNNQNLDDEDSSGDEDENGDELQGSEEDATEGDGDEDEDQDEGEDFDESDKEEEKEKDVRKIVMSKKVNKSEAPDRVGDDQNPDRMVLEQDNTNAVNPNGQEGQKQIIQFNASDEELQLTFKYGKFILENRLPFSQAKPLTGISIVLK